MSARAGEPALWKPWRFPLRILALATVWALALTVPWIAVLATPLQGQLPGVPMVLALCASSAGLTIACGAAVAFSDSPSRRGAGVFLVGCVAEAVGLYLIADAPTGQTADDRGASIAVAVLLPPVALAMALLLFTGVAAGLGVRLLGRQLRRA